MNLPEQFHPLALCCAKCDTHLTLTIELVEYLVAMENDGNGEASEFDAAIQAALAGMHRKPHFRSPQAIFPLAVDKIDGSINFIGWCQTCQEARLAATTIKQLAQLVSDTMKGGSDEKLSGL